MTEIIEVEATEVEEKEEEKDRVRCSFTVTLTEQGNISMQVEGYEQNILFLDSMANYARKTVDKKMHEQLGL